MLFAKPTIISDGHERIVTSDTPSNGDFHLWNRPSGHAARALISAGSLSCLCIVRALHLV